MKVKDMNVEVSKLKPARFNPQRRTDTGKLSTLMASIATNGIMTPIAITEGYEIGDGHRRVVCAKALNLETIPARMYYGMTTAEIWCSLNASQMSMTPAQWWEAVVHGLPLESKDIPRSLQRLIGELQVLLEPETIWGLVDRGVSPKILDTAKYVGRYMGWTEPEQVAKIIKWFALHETQFKARRIVSDQHDPEILIEAVESMRNINFSVELE